MEASGYVRRSDEATDARQRPVTLTDPGRELLRTVEQIHGSLEAEWESAIGADAVARLRRDLVVVLSDGEGHLPPVRPTW